MGDIAVSPVEDQQRPERRHQHVAPVVKLTPVNHLPRPPAPPRPLTGSPQACGAEQSIASALGQDQSR